MKQQAKPRPTKVLVVDDDPVIRDMMVDILEFEGYPIRVARNGNEALEQMRGEESYLVFLDLLMPIVSGKDVCDILDKDPPLRSRHIIILMSALDRLEEASALNIDGVMPKPFLVDDVVNAIQPYMGTTG
jgi:CheY-like chemotaxis protein